MRNRWDSVGTPNAITTLRNPSIDVNTKFYDVSQ